MSAEDRLRWYARFFDCVEVNSSFYALPSPRNAARWAERTPPGFLFHIKAYSLMTGHHPRLDTLPPEVRLMLPENVSLRRRGEIDRARIPPEALDRCFELFRAAVEPLAAAGKLGYVLFQLAPWVRYEDATLEYLASLPARLPGFTLAVEFRNETWIPERTDEVVAFLRQHGLALVTLDAVWQPWVEAATTPRVVRPPPPRPEPPRLARPAAPASSRRWPRSTTTSTGRKSSGSWPGAPGASTTALAGWR